MRLRTALPAVAVLVALAHAAIAAPLGSAAALARGLAGGRRAEATVRYSVATPGGSERVVHATLALERPDLARLDVAGTGEKLVARGDGGEWLQPATHQLLRFQPRHAAAALRWWRVLLGSESGARERAVGAGRWVVTLFGPAGAAVDSAEVWTDGRGLPARLVVPAGDPAAVVYRLGGWRFVAARGAADFRLAPPAGFESVPLP